MRGPFLRAPETNPVAFEAGCAGKEEYPSETAALAALDLIRRGRVKHYKVPPADRAKLRAYACQFCGEYHVGH